MQRRLVPLGLGLVGALWLGTVVAAAEPEPAGILSDEALEGEVAGFALQLETNAGLIRFASEGAQLRSSRALGQLRSMSMSFAPTEPVITMRNGSQSIVIQNIQ